MCVVHKVETVDYLTVNSYHAMAEFKSMQGRKEMRVRNYCTMHNSLFQILHFIFSSLLCTS